MRVISYVSIKGGTGKSSLTILTANKLAELGKRVLVIDLDVQNSTTFYFLDKPGQVERRNIARGLQNLDLLGNLLESNKPNIRVLGSSFELIDLRAINEKRLKQLLPQLADEFDYCLIDCAPTYDNLVLNGIHASDLVVTPVLLAQFDFKSASFLKAKLTLETEKVPNWKLLFNAYKESRSVGSTTDQYRHLFESGFQNILKTRIPASTFVRKITDLDVKLTCAKAMEKLYRAVDSLVAEIG
jgi:chromosome partitioning protein